MATSINGFGTTFYGQSDFESDGSFITTKWIILAFVPVIPTGSLRLRYAQGQGFFSSGTNYEVIMEMQTDIAQVMRTWAYLIGIVAVLALPTKGSGAGWNYALIGAMALLPHTLRWFAKRKGAVDQMNVPPRREIGATPAFRSRLEDLPLVSTCPKCKYTRKPDDYAPTWQCPSCKVAYNKVSN